MNGVPEDDFRATISDALRHHLGTILTVGYIILTIAGITFEFFLFVDLHANILDYSEAGDFLTAALRSPAVIAFTLLPIPLLLALVGFDRWLGRRFPRYGALLRRSQAPFTLKVQRLVVYPLFVFIYFAAFTVHYAGRESARGRGEWRPWCSLPESPRVTHCVARWWDPTPGSCFYSSRATPPCA